MNTKTAKNAVNTVNSADMKEDKPMKSVFETLNAINVNDHTERKNGLTYLSWAWAWAEVKKRYPDANYAVYERDSVHGPLNYFDDGRTAWVKTGVFINGLQHIEMLPVMDFRNRSIPVDQITSTDVNKAIQRSLTKAIARHGLGLYIYAGEDLPEDERQDATQSAGTQNEAQPDAKPAKSRVAAVKGLCASIGITLEQFGAYRNAAAQNGIIPDLKISELSDSDYEALLRFVRLNAGQTA